MVRELYKIKGRDFRSKNLKKINKKTKLKIKIKKHTFLTNKQLKFLFIGANKKI